MLQTCLSGTRASGRGGVASKVPCTVCVLKHHCGIFTRSRSHTTPEAMAGSVLLYPSSQPSAVALSLLLSPMSPDQATPDRLQTGIGHGQLP